MRLKNAPVPAPLPVWIRYRFQSTSDDYRPVKFPPPGPYWCSGYTVKDDFSVGNSILIAYLPADVSLFDYWPEASEVEGEPKAEIQFTDRFPKPDWWKEPQP